ncbi:MAG TPA: DUF6174 domain-containing protein [Chloroflexaceae bacterium]|nr:DUF6174 domain-containing protein [Chloroflexaceae bacterium]
MKAEGSPAGSSARSWLPPRRRRWLVVAALALLLSLGALAALRQPASAGSGLAEARRLWAANGLDSYRLRVTQQTPLGTCEQEMLTAGTTVTPVSNTCGMPATWTVPRLFSWIAELDREQVNCYPDPSMCACRGAMATSVQYDQATGYPREVVYEWRKRPNLTNVAYYRSLLDRSFPGCNRDGRGGPVIYTVSLTAEP